MSTRLRLGPSILALAVLAGAVTMITQAGQDEDNEATFSIQWEASGTTPLACEWSRNAPGVGQPCPDMPDAHKGDGGYRGYWEYTIHAERGDVLFLAAQGIGVRRIRCQSFWHGRFHEFQAAAGRCGGTYTLG